MAVRKFVEWLGKRYFGHTNFGAGVVSDSWSEAKEALVFLLVSLNARRKVPIAYLRKHI